MKNLSFLQFSLNLLSHSRIAILFIIVISGFNQGYSQTTVFSDNFESGIANWTLQGTWELTTSKSYSQDYSLTTANSSGSYLDNQNISATLTNGVNLSPFLGAEIDFYCQYSLEQSFDFAYLELSTDNGNCWYQIDSFNGTLSSWTLFKYDIGCFVGNSNVIVRFRLKSDQYVEAAGLYVDNFQIIGLSTDNSSPFISAQCPQFYQGLSSSNIVNCQIFDASGIQSSTLYYNVGSSGPISISPSSVVGNNYTFTIPSQLPGSLVYYKIGATDNSPAHNCSDTSKALANYYISGTYISYDDAGVDGVSQFTSSGSSGAAVEYVAPSSGTATLVSALLRNLY